MSKKTVCIVGLAAWIVAACAPLAPLRGDEVTKKCDAQTVGNKCEIKVVATARGDDICEGVQLGVDPDVLELVGDKPVDIEVTLPDSFSFCEGDGLKAASILKALEIPVPSPASCQPKLSFTWPNRVRNAYYPYALWFHHATKNTKCKIDPFIKNG